MRVTTRRFPTPEGEGAGGEIVADSRAQEVGAHVDGAQPGGRIGTVRRLRAATQDAEKGRRILPRCRAPRQRCRRGGSFAPGFDELVPHREAHEHPVVLDRGEFESEPPSKRDQFHRGLDRSGDRFGDAARCLIEPLMMVCLHGVRLDGIADRSCARPTSALSTPPSIGSAPRYCLSWEPGSLY